MEIAYWIIVGAMLTLILLRGIGASRRARHDTGRLLRSVERIAEQERRRDGHA